MTNKNELSLKPGEIRLEYISLDWPLTPLSRNKDPYIPGWQNKPMGVTEIEEEILTGRCKAVGLLGGPVFNHPYGLVWVDVDGATVYQLIEKLAGTPFDEACPKTLTILSGKEGRERKLYKIHRDKQKHFVRNKYTWHAEGDKEKLEILWSRHQGVLMGLHPETDGYFTAEKQGFEWSDELPDFPDWLLNEIIQKNVKQGIPAKETTRIVGPTFAVNAQISLERDMQLATEALWGMPPEAADDYDIWIIVGQSLHSLDESLLDEWEAWSKQSDKYRDGDCHKRWLSFSKGGGRGIGSLIHVAKENGWKPSEEHRALNVDDNTLDHVSKLLEELEKDLGLTKGNEMIVSENALKSEKTVQAWATKQSPRTSGRGKEQEQHTSGRGKDQRSRNPSSDVVTSILLQMYEGDLRYSQAHGAFVYYGYHSKGLWSQLSDYEIKGDIKNKLDQVKENLLPNGYSMNLVSDVMEQLRISIIFDDWYEGNEHLLFTNGILDIETRVLMEFDREMYIPQQLPYDYDPYATCEDIIKWLKEAQNGSWGRVQVLRAWLRAVLLSNSDIQKFVEIVGPGKSGKSTYSNLAQALVGDDNAMISSLEHLEKNRFETANLYKKKLLLFNDVERYGGSVSVLKAITGRDLIRNERKFQAGSQKPFKFNGLVMITANEPIQTTDPTSGLARRRLTIPFDRPFTGSSAEQKTLIDMDDKGRPFGEFASLLPGLVNWVLDMGEVEMREYLMETTEKVPFFAKHHRDQILKSNQIMDWMQHCIVFDPGISTPIGLAKHSPGGSANIYTNWDKYLYASYCEFSRASNGNILGRSRFESLLMDVCVHQLGLNVYQTKNKDGMRVVNIAARTSSNKYDEYPSLIEVGLNKEEWKTFYGDVLYKKTNVKMEEDASEI
jgi:phage/plasmid-associated DNA primase